jgi:hypothetical protein
MKTRILAAAIAVALLAMPALAQQPAPNPVMEKTVAALKALLDLRDAEMTQLRADAQEFVAANEAKWAEYAKSLWQPEAPK